MKSIYTTSTRKADYIIPDCIDIQVEILPVPFDEIASQKKGEASEDIRRRVIAARQVQLERFKDEKNVYCNAMMSSRLITQYARPDDEGLQRLKQAMTRYDLSARAYDRILKVARTIADLDGSEGVSVRHITEAIGYRNLDRGDWANKGR